MPLPTPRSPGSPDAQLVITTSFPRFPGDPAGHFVEQEALDWQRTHGSVRVLAAGQARPDFIPPVPVQWLGGAPLFAEPGAWPRVQENPTRLLHLLPTSSRLFQLVRRAPEPHILHHWLLPWGPWVARALRSTPRKRVEMVAHGSDVRLLERFPRALQQIFFHELRQSSVQLRVVSHELQERLLALPSLSHSTIRWIERAEVRPSPLSFPSLPSREEARRQLGLLPHKQLVLVVGRLIPSKQVDRALHQCLTLPEAQVQVLGEGPLLAQLEQQFPQVEFLGARPRPEVLLRLRAAHLLVSASEEEGAPTAIREARELGTPVVSAPAGDLRSWAQSDPQLWLSPSRPGTLPPEAHSYWQSSLSPSAP